MVSMGYSTLAPHPRAGTGICHLLSAGGIPTFRLALVQFRNVSLPDRGADTAANAGSCASIRRKGALPVVEEVRMAKIVLGAGTSHTPMLLAADETLPRFEETDRTIKHRDKEGRPVTYGDLLERADPKLAHLVAPEHLVARQNVARAAVRRLREAVGAAALDALIVFGDDQNESYLED